MLAWLRIYWRAGGTAGERFIFSEARAKQTRVRDANAISFKHVAMKANPAPGCREDGWKDVEPSRTQNLSTQILPEEDTRHLPPRTNQLVEDGQMVLKDERARASGEKRLSWQHAAVKWDPCDSPKSPPNTDLSTRTIRCPDGKSVQLTEGCKRVGGGEAWMLREESRGRVNISYTYYQTEL